MGFETRSKHSILQLAYRSSRFASTEDMDVGTGLALDGGTIDPRCQHDDSYDGCDGLHVGRVCLDVFQKS